MPLIAFASPKGGVGKTTLTAHVAAILASRGYDVMCIDLDPQNALRLHLGLNIRDESGFMCRLGQRGTWQSARRETPAGVNLLPYGAAEPRRALELNSALLAKPEMLLDPVREMLGEPNLVILLDNPPGPSPALEALTPVIDLMVIVLLGDAGSAAVIPGVASGHFVGSGILATRTAEKTVAVVLNQVELASPLSAAVMECAAATFGSRLLGAVCRDDALGEALADKHLLTEATSGAAEDLQALTDAIVARMKLQLPSSRRRGDFAALADWGLR